MKITTWNVNGIRSLKKSMQCILTELSSDITCFQETKISRSQLQESTALIDGYTSYFSYPRKQSGYSGVATYCKDSSVPKSAEEGLSGMLNSKYPDDSLKILDTFDISTSELSELDSEGRVIITHHLFKYADELQRLSVINVYCPCVDPEKPERHLYKMQFCHLLEAKTQTLLNEGSFVVIVGDLNISCSLIDHCDPCDENEFNSSEARQWLKAFLSREMSSCDGDVRIIDAFRHFYPDRKNAFTCWNTKIGARLTNYGTRIDYILISSNLLPLLESCEIISDYYGSDHCPVSAVLKCDSVSDSHAQLPSICTRLWPEFSGRQQKLQTFLQKTQTIADSVTKNDELSFQPAFVRNKPVIKKNKQKAITNFFKTTSSVQDISEAVSPKSSLEELEISQTANCLDPNTVNPDLSNDTCVSVFNNLDTNKDQISSSPRNNQSLEWKSVLKGPPKPPLCSRHHKECVLRTVKKKGPNCGRQFFMCSLPVGHSSNPEANCNFFKWATAPKASMLKRDNCS